MEQNYESIFPEKQVVYAGFWMRFGASFLDGLIIGVPLYAIAYATGLSTNSGMRGLNLLVGWLYSALQESGPSQATIGKKALGIKVTTVNGERLSFGQATGRHFGKILSLLILLIGYFMMLWDEKSQTLHDKMAGAVVVMN